MCLTVFVFIFDLESWSDFQFMNMIADLSPYWMQSGFLTSSVETLFPDTF